MPFFAIAIKMEWNFTPEDVRTGKTHYSVVQFRENLLKEIRDVVGNHRDGEKFT